MARAPFIKILPYTQGKFGRQIVERFWSHVDKRGPNECWDWTLSRTEHGYGRFKLTSWTSAHTNRIALAIWTGEEPDGLMALHSCDRPSCCNPHHLRWGTEADNMRDKSERGRAYSGNQSGANNGAAKLSEGQLRLVVDRFRKGWNNKQIARDLPIGHSMVSKIRCGHMWKEQVGALGWSPRLSPQSTEGG